MGKLAQFIRDVREDLRRYGDDGGAGFGKCLKYWCLNLGFFVLFTWRYARLLHSLGIRCWPRYTLKRHHIGISLSARIDGGVQLGHGTGIVIGAGAVVKRGVTIYQDVTLGSRGRSEPSGAGGGYPVVEEDAVIYAGAKIIGPVTIGRGACVAAGALVLEDVPPGMTAVGNPARVVGRPPDGAAQPVAPEPGQ